MTFMNDPALIASFKREVAPLGRFATMYPGVTDDDIAGALADSFAGGQIQGFFPEYELDPVAGDVTPDLSPGMTQLIVMLAGIQQLRVSIAGADTRSSYEAGPVKYERERSASVLAELLRSAEDRLNRLINDLVKEGALGTEVYTLDSYRIRIESETYQGVGL